MINEKIQAKNKFNNKINIIKDIINYYETETNNYNKKLSRYKNYINVADITEIELSSIATTPTSTSVALTGIRLPYSIPTAFATAKVCGSLPKTINTKIENKKKQFLRDIGYKQRGETKSNRSKVIRRLSFNFASRRRDSFSSESTVDNSNEEEEEVKASCLTETDPNNLVERLQLLKLETKAGHDGLYDEMLDISKQQLSMNIFNQEQLDNFVFNYGK